MKDKFLSTEVQKILDIKRSRLQDWKDREWAVPSIKKAESQGDRDIYSLGDVYALGVFKFLIDLKLPRNLAKYYIRSLALKFNLEGKDTDKINGKINRDFCWLSMFRGQVGPFNIRIIDNPREAIALQEKDELIFLINLVSVIKNIDASIAEIER